MEIIDKQTLEEIKEKLRKLSSSVIGVCSMLDKLADWNISLTVEKEDPQNGIYTIEHFLHMIHTELYLGFDLIPPPPYDKTAWIYDLDI